MNEKAWDYGDIPVVMSPQAVVTTLVCLIASFILLMRWRMQHEQRKALVATSVALDMRKERQQRFPPAPHVWSEETRTTPQVCCLCHELIRPNRENLVMACQVCGVAVHQQCQHRVPADCKRCLTRLDAGQNLHHFVVTSSAAESGDKSCFVCQEQCGGMGLRPIWRCVWCQELAHMDCITESITAVRPWGLRRGYGRSNNHSLGSMTHSASVGRILNGNEGNLHMRGRSFDDSETRNVQNGISKSGLVSRKGGGGGGGARNGRISPDTVLDSPVWKECICSLGQHCRMVVPPQCVIMTPEAERKFQLGWAHALKLQRQLHPLLFKSLSEKRRKSHDQSDKILSGPQYWVETQGFILETLSEGCRPLLVFVNPSSGPREGDEIIRRLRSVLNPIQVVALSRNHGPQTALNLFKGVPNLRVLVCGGDGTVGWVMNELVAMFGYGKTPPVAVWPMGTGNDLAQCLGWTSNTRWLRGNAGLQQALNAVDNAALTLLDKWKVTFERESTQRKRSGKVSIVEKGMNNYVGIGIDAKVTLEFHSLRESYPDWFHSQMGNKLWYTGVGAKGMIWDRLNLSSYLSVECDGEAVELPQHIQGVLILNIASYMGGIDVWRGSEEAAESEEEEDCPWQPQRMHDGLIEVVGVGGPFHLGQMQVGLSHAHRLAQCSRVDITIKEAIPVQIDGEPWEQKPCKVSIEHSGQVTMLRRMMPRTRRGTVAPEHVPAALAEVLDDAYSAGEISSDARTKILAEIVRRVE